MWGDSLSLPGTPFHHLPALQLGHSGYWGSQNSFLLRAPVSTHKLWACVLMTEVPLVLSGQTHVRPQPSTHSGVSREARSAVKQASWVYTVQEHTHVHTSMYTHTHPRTTHTDTLASALAMCTHTLIHSTLELSTLASHPKCIGPGLQTFSSPQLQGEWGEECSGKGKSRTQMCEVPALPDGGTYTFTHSQIRTHVPSTNAHTHTLGASPL